MNEHSTEFEQVVEHIAAAADEVAESFMERHRRRPNGAGDGLYDLCDAFSAFANALRTPPAGGGEHVMAKP